MSYLSDEQLHSLKCALHNCEDILYAEQVPADARTRDVSEAYAVVSSDDATCGCIVYALNHGEWTANPWNVRWVVMRLLALREPLQAELDAANYERNLAQLQATTLRKALETANDAMCQATFIVGKRKSDLNHAIDVARKLLNTEPIESTTDAN